MSKIIKILLSIRALIFHILLMLCTAFFGVLLMPSYLMTKKHSVKFARMLGRRWAKTILVLLRYICNITYTIQNEELLGIHAPCILACKHQSMFETILFLAILPKAVYVVKEELLRIPVYGRYLKEMAMIAVNRQGSFDAIRDMNAKIKEEIENGFSVIIFPEGSRIPYGQQSQCRLGIFFLYRSLKTSILPISLNSGKFWPKNILIKNSGVINLQIYPAMQQNLTRDSMLETLNDTINHIK